MEPTKAQFNKNSEERRKRRTKFLFVALLALMIFSVGIIAFLRKPEMQIKDVEVSGTKALNAREIVTASQEVIAGNHAWVIPKSNVLLFSKRHMRTVLLSRFPGISDLVIAFKSKNTITVTISEKEPNYVWCTPEETCFFVDDSGMIFKEAPYFSNGVYIVFTGNVIEPSDTIIRSRFMSANDFQALTALVATLKAFPVGLVGVHSDPVGDVTLGVESLKNFTLGSNTQLLVTRTTSKESIVENLNLLLSDKTFTNGLVSKGKDLEIIDFRFPGKIYYKFKNGAPIPTESATTTAI